MNICPNQGLTALEYDEKDPISDVERALINTGRSIAVWFHQKKVSSQISKGWVFCWSVLYGIRSSSRVHLPKDLQRSLQDQYGKGKVLQEGMFEA